MLYLGERNKSIEYTLKWMSQKFVTNTYLLDLIGNEWKNWSDNLSTSLTVNDKYLLVSALVYFLLTQQNKIFPSFYLGGSREFPLNEINKLKIIH